MRILSSILVSFAVANPLFDPELFNSEYFELGQGSPDWPRPVFGPTKLLRPWNPNVESIDTSPHNNGTTFNSNFGINYVDCASSYFRPGAYWPLQSAANAGTTVRLCNNVFGKQHYYATLFSVTDRIPVYSGFFTVFMMENHKLLNNFKNNCNYINSQINPGGGA